MINVQEAPLRKTSLLAALCCIALAAADSARADNDKASGPWIVGTWYLTLDTTIFGFPPGFPFSGLAIFHADGTYVLQDAGDFGQATFLNTQNSQQFGSWRMAPGGTIVGTALFLEADLATGEVLRWQRTESVLHRQASGGVAGTVTAYVLECDNLLPIPTPVTCPDPIESADAFVVVPPADIPITLKRLTPGP